jgi:hypothetical protein
MKSNGGLRHLRNYLGSDARVAIVPSGRPRGVKAACPASLAIGRRVFSLAEAPPLPLAGCPDVTGCTCTYAYVTF